ncbi:4-hydroxythreonine-4-phosphate dehydrogenase [Campylobacterota bacterium]|nr:4-hydroxythreonine-4-phosphate dehydrogenase [Campylobacterota bacterium]
MKTVAISIGDLGGVGFEIALAAHDEVVKLARPIYCVSSEMAHEAARLLGRELPHDFDCEGNEAKFAIRVGAIDANAGRASFESFVQAVDLAASGKADAVVTLPIHKAAWKAASLAYRGHTDYLRERFGEGVMALGCALRFVLFYTDHIPLCEVAPLVRAELLTPFLVRVASLVKSSPIGVLGLNPHSGDHGAIGTEDGEVELAIAAANRAVGAERFVGAIVPDAAFSPKAIAQFPVIVALYHDQGLAPLKALFFEESINVTLGLPIVRTSVDHGTAFDIAYQHKNPSTKSYTNAIKEAISPFCRCFSSEKSQRNG